ncbi:RNA polymerase sigma factor [uncultured Jatrophihabitans sp.]|uniref:RNA polymerase sigma factor n=1 Tax=uncultured Jatrophihabitans sp. TaxID=1610747 RepID=UPI0035CAA4D6
MISDVRSVERPAGEPGDPPDDGAAELDFSAHLRPMFRLAVTLSSLDEADDIVQDALTRAWAKRHQFDLGRGSLRSWLLAIVADQARSRWRRPQPIWEVLDPGSLTTPAAGEVGADLRQAVAALPQRQRAAVILHHFVDLPVTEVAALMRCAPGTVKSTLHDARKALAIALGESYARD